MVEVGISKSKKFNTEKYINSGNTYITDNFSKEDLLNDAILKYGIFTKKLISKEKKK